MQEYDSLIDNDPYFQRRLEEKAKEAAANSVAKEAERLAKALKVAEEKAAKALKEVEEMKLALEHKVRVLQELAVEAVQDRFPLLAEYARKQVLFVKQPEELRRLVRQIYKAPDEATARWLLGTFSD
ncbi:MAG TPA: hypothetical protein VFA41_03900 [Ktedonobacteraceae bacterium]|jgi:alcohol dehydrogenase class IV|nr:hypothetical protein [Ktedonobacteraceae bacterium]